MAPSTVVRWGQIGSGAAKQLRRCAACTSVVYVEDPPSAISSAPHIWEEQIRWCLPEEAALLELGR